MHVIDFLDRNDPKKTGKPFFVWYNLARMHVTAVLAPKYLAMLGLVETSARQSVGSRSSSALVSPSRHTRRPDRIATPLTYGASAGPISGAYRLRHAEEDA
jgi:hypothetical protein